MQLERREGETVPLRRLLWRSRRRRWVRGDSASMGPRRLREGRMRAVTRPFGEQTTPCHAAVQASPPVQLESRRPCASVWRRKRVSAYVSLLLL